MGAVEGSGVGITVGDMSATDGTMKWMVNKQSTKRNLEYVRVTIWPSWPVPRNPDTVIGISKYANLRLKSATIISISKKRHYLINYISKSKRKNNSKMQAIIIIELFI